MKRKPAKRKAAPKDDAGTFKKLAPPRVPQPRTKVSYPDVVAAMRDMIEAGRARQIAATLPDLMAVSAGLGDITAQALQAFVMEQAKTPEAMSREDAQFIFDVHRGTVEGLTKAYETVAAVPVVAGGHNEHGHAIAGQIIEPAAAAPRRTKLFAALEAVNAAIDVTPKN